MALRPDGPDGAHSPSARLARQYLDLQPLGLGEAPLKCLSCELKQHRHYQQYSLLGPGGTGCKWADQDAGHPLPSLLNSCSRMMFDGVSQIGNGACRDSGEFQFDVHIPDEF